MTVRLRIQGDTLTWARIALGVEIDEVARAAGIRPEKFRELERGEQHPTMPQLRKIAHKLDRPVAFFMTPVPEVSDVPSTADFRGRADDTMPPRLLTEMKRAQSRRQTLIDLAPASDDPLPMLPVDWDNVVAQASYMRDLLGLDADFRPPGNDPNATFAFWRGLLEHRGILIFQTTGIPYSTFRGLSLFYETFPVILLNGADSANGKIFTLFHELAHLGTRTSGVCLLREDVFIEALCNKFAANVLMPEQAVREALVLYSASDPVNMLCRRFKVSSLAAAVRLKVLGVMTEEQVDQVRAQSDADWEQARQRQSEGDGFVPNWRLRYRDLGTAYMGVIFDALQNDRISYLDASYMLEAKLPTVEKMLFEFHRQGN